MGQDKLLDCSLLKVSEFLKSGGDLSSSISNSLDVIGGSNSTSAAGVYEGNTRTLDLSNCTVSSNTNMGSIRNKTVSIVGNVGCHGTETSITSKGKTSKSSKVEIVPVNTIEVILKLTSKFVTAKRGSKKSVSSSVSLTSQDIYDLGDESLVVKSTREVLLDLRIELSICLGGIGKNRLCFLGNVRFISCNNVQGRVRAGCEGGGCKCCSRCKGSNQEGGTAKIHYVNSVRYY
mmetsp:Transcript_16211/g.24239  ORF Transcript_16211/g.24239 Transcript_16211/m.24239 type:complete len:233 (-) Transcript_16211:22-720(-)